MWRSFFLITALIVVSSFGDRNVENSANKTEDPLRTLNKTPTEKRECSARVISAGEKGYDDGFPYGKALVESRIRNILCDSYPLLDRAIRIKTFYVEGVLRPPIIGQKTVSVPIDGGNGYVKKGKVYYVAEKARFVSRPMDWRDFLGFDEKTCGKLDSPEVSSFFNPPDAGKCKEVAERYGKRFIEGAKQGYDLTIDDYVFKLKKMDAFINGLSLYHKLYYERKMDPPVIARVESKVEKGKDRLSIENSYYRIISRAKFTEDAKEWKNFVYEK